MGNVKKNGTFSFNRPDGIVNQVDQSLLHLLAIQIQGRDVARILNLKLNRGMSFTV